MSSEYATSGLRLSGRYTSARNVVISIAHAVLAAADGAEALALEPDRVGPRPHELLDDVGAGVGREVDVGRLAVAHVRSRKASRTLPAHEEALVAGVDEQARELLRGRRGVEQRPQAGRERGHRHHSRRLGTRTTRTNSPAPPSRATRSARSTTVAGVDGAPTCSRLGCDEPAVAVFAFDAPRVPRVARPARTRPGRGRRGALRTPRRPHVTARGAGTSSTGAAPESRLWIGSPARRRRPRHRGPRRRTGAPRRARAAPGPRCRSTARARTASRRARGGPHDRDPCRRRRRIPTPIRRRGRPTTDPGPSSSTCSTPARRCSRARSSRRAATTTS